MSGANHERGPSHLIERAAEMLRRDGVASGLIDGSAAGMLDGERPARADAAPPPDAAPAPLSARNGSGLNGRPQPPEPTGATAFPPLAAPTFAGVGGAARDRLPLLTHDAMVAAGMIDWSKARTRLSEEFRVVQAQVLRNAFSSGADASPAGAGHGGGQFGAQGAANGEAKLAGNVVMVTSARPREGKSFTSLNLAASIARQKDRDVLLVDIDSKRESLTDQLGLHGRPGLMELASDPRVDPQSLMLPTEMPHLSVLSFGASPDGAELLASRQMARVIRNLGRRYADRIVILDAPPCLASSDASAVAPIVGQIVFVVEAEQTQRPEVEAALDLIQSCPTITLLLNKVQVRSRHTFGGYYSTYSYSS